MMVPPSQIVAQVLSDVGSATMLSVQTEWGICVRRPSTWKWRSRRSDGGKPTKKNATVPVWSGSGSGSGSGSTPSASARTSTVPQARTSSPGSDSNDTDNGRGEHHSHGGEDTSPAASSARSSATSGSSSTLPTPTLALDGVTTTKNNSNNNNKNTNSSDATASTTSYTSNNTSATALPTSPIPTTDTATGTGAGTGTAAPAAPANPHSTTLAAVAGAIVVDPTPKSTDQHLLIARRDQPEPPSHPATLLPLHLLPSVTVERGVHGETAWHASLSVSTPLPGGATVARILGFEWLASDLLAQSTARDAHHRDHLTRLGFDPDADPYLVDLHTLSRTYPQDPTNPTSSPGSSFPASSASSASTSIAESPSSPVAHVKAVAAAAMDGVQRSVENLGWFGAGRRGVNGDRDPRSRQQGDPWHVFSLSSPREGRVGWRARGVRGDSGVGLGRSSRGLGSIGTMPGVGLAGGVGVAVGRASIEGPSARNSRDVSRRSLAQRELHKGRRFSMQALERAFAGGGGGELGSSVGGLGVVAGGVTTSPGPGPHAVAGAGVGVGVGTGAIDRAGIRHGNGIGRVVGVDPSSSTWMVADGPGSGSGLPRGDGRGAGRSECGIKGVVGDGGYWCVQVTMGLGDVKFVDVPPLRQSRLTEGRR